MLPVTCESVAYIFSGSLKSKEIVDKEFLSKFEEELNKLQPKDELRNVDIRIKCLIDYGDNIDTLCLGEHFDTVLNGKLMTDNPVLLKLIKEKVY